MGLWVRSCTLGSATMSSSLTFCGKANASTLCSTGVLRLHGSLREPSLTFSCASDVCALW
jgi:hypothetical protein